MSLQFIAGGSGSGKTRYLYEKVIKESQEHPEIQYLFIVPEQYTMQTQKELVRLHPRHGLLNIDVLSFKRLAYRVFEDLGVQLPAVLDDMGKSMENNVVFFIRLTLSKRLQANHREFAAVNNGNVNCFFILHWHSPFAE